MPYEAHQSFQSPEDENASIWRYMDLARFLTILETRAMFFPSVAKLAEQDPFEGRYTSKNALALRFRWENRPESDWKQIGIPTREALEARQLLVREKLSASHLRETVCVSCWHLGDYESDAMWKLYATVHGGVAIRSTVARLRACFSGYEHGVFVGLVQYIDYTNAIIGLSDDFAPCLHKRKSFEHERELRAATMLHGDRPPDADRKPIAEEPAASLRLPIQIPQGISVSVDVARLIDSVYVSPLAPGWFVELVRILCKRYETTYGMALPVEHSALAAVPPI